jgi:DNA-binding PadR family transcriptional regulator
MRDTYPLALNHVLAALQFLEENELVEIVDYTAKRELKIYDITSKRRAALRQLCGK